MVRLRYNSSITNRTSITNRKIVSWSMPLLAINMLVVVVVLVGLSGITVKVVVVASAACVATVVMVETAHKKKKIGDREIVPWCLVPPSAFADDTLALPVPDRMEKFERQVRKTTLNFS